MVSIAFVNGDKLHFAIACHRNIRLQDVEMGLNARNEAYVHKRSIYPYLAEYLHSPFDYGYEMQEQMSLLLAPGFVDSSFGVRQQM